MVTRVSACILVGSLGALGCYDMEELDPDAENTPSRLLVDDFEDPSFSPKLRDFGPWTAFPFKPTAGATWDADIVESGFESGHSLRGDFTFAGSNDDYTGASLGIKAQSMPLDVRPFRTLYVTARFDRGGSPLPQLTRFYADLNCDSAPPLVPGTRPLWITDNIPMTSDWQRFPLVAFDEPSSEPDKIAGSPQSCLAVVDAIRFTVSTVVPNGETVSGHLFIDDVYFE